MSPLCGWGRVGPLAGLIVSYKRKAPLLAKNARNGAPSKRGNQNRIEASRRLALRDGVLHRLLLVERQLRGQSSEPRAWYQAAFLSSLRDSAPFLPGLPRTY